MFENYLFERMIREPIDKKFYILGVACRFYIILAVLLCGIVNSFSLEFVPTSCTPVPLDSSDNYLSTTAYGYITSNIDMQIYASNPCNRNDLSFNFCIYNPLQSSPPCEPVELQLGDTVALGAVSSNPDIGGNAFLSNIPLSVSQITETLICLTMPTSRGASPIACKSTEFVNPMPPPIEPDCSMIGKSCYGTNLSQSLLRISGLTVQCVSDTLENLFFQKTTCNNIEFTSLAPFSSFQQALTNAVGAALILYVMFYGFKVVMNHEYVNLDKVAGFILKFLFVTYFAVGLGPITFQDGKATTQNGMTQWALPFMKGAIADFAYMVYSSGGSQGLCQFDQKQYPEGYKYYALWDAIDCRIGYYLGMQLLYNTSSIVTSLGGRVSNSETNSFSDQSQTGESGHSDLSAPDNFAFFTTMFGFLMSGEIIILICGVAFVIIFGSIMLSFISTYLVCLISMYAMAYVSPIFITMALFERTKSYFDNWLKITLSCILQPAILAGFISLLLTLYDDAVYGTCQFQRYDYTLGDNNFSTFELRIPNINPNDCTDSMGYKLFQAYKGGGWGRSILLLLSVDSLRDTLNFSVSMLYILALSFIFYHFSSSFAQFTSAITDGPALEAVIISPQKIIQAIQKLMEEAKQSGKNEGGEKPKDEKESKDKSSSGSGDGEASDKAGTEGGEASDKFGAENAAQSGMGG
jgi:type IV secretion system protein VirB6